MRKKALGREDCIASRIIGLPMKLKQNKTKKYIDICNSFFFYERILFIIWVMLGIQFLPQLLPQLVQVTSGGKGWSCGPKIFFIILHMVAHDMALDHIKS